MNGMFGWSITSQTKSVTVNIFKNDVCSLESNVQYLIFPRVCMHVYHIIFPLLGIPYSFEQLQLN